MKPWDTVLNELKAVLDPDAFATWIAPLRLTSASEKVILWSPNAHLKEKVEQDYLPLLAESIGVDVDYVSVRIGTPAPPSPPERAHKDATPEKSSGAESSARPRPKPKQIENAAPYSFSIPWAENARGLSKHMARTSLFTVNLYSEKHPRPQLLQKQVYSFNNVRLFQTGAELNQFDESVFLAILHLQRRFTFGTLIPFSMREVADIIGLAVSGKSIKRIEESLIRLQESKVRVEVDGEDRLGYHGQLISDLVTREPANSARPWGFRLSPELFKLFDGDSLSYFPWEDRIRLTKEVSQKLHTFYLTHNKPHPLLVSTLYKISGARTDMKRFRSLLKAALNELCGLEPTAKGQTSDGSVAKPNPSGRPPLLAWWKIVDDKVIVQKN